MTDILRMLLKEIKCIFIAFLHNTSSPSKVASPTYIGRVWKHNISWIATGHDLAFFVIKLSIVHSSSQSTHFGEKSLTPENDTAFWNFFVCKGFSTNEFIVTKKSIQYNQIRECNKKRKKC